MHDILRQFADGEGRHIHQRLAVKLRQFSDDDFTASQLREAIEEAVEEDLADPFIIQALRAILDWKIRQNAERPDQP